MFPQFYRHASLLAWATIVVGNSWAYPTERSAEGARDGAGDVWCREELGSGIRKGWVVGLRIQNAVLIRKCCSAIPGVDTGLTGGGCWWFGVGDGWFEEVLGVGWGWFRIPATGGGKSSSGIRGSQSLSIVIAAGVGGDCNRRVVVGGVAMMKWWEKVGSERWECSERDVDLGCEEWFK